MNRHHHDKLTIIAMSSTASCTCDDKETVVFPSSSRRRKKYWESALQKSPPSSLSHSLCSNPNPQRNRHLKKPKDILKSHYLYISILINRVNYNCYLWINGRGYIIGCAEGWIGNIENPKGNWPKRTNKFKPCLFLPLRLLIPPTCLVDGLEIDPGVGPFVGSFSTSNRQGTASFLKWLAPIFPPPFPTRPQPTPLPLSLSLSFTATSNVDKSTKSRSVRRSPLASPPRRRRIHFPRFGSLSLSGEDFFWFYPLLMSNNAPH